MDNTEHNQNTANKRHYARVMAFAVLAMVSIAVAAFFYFMSASSALEDDRPVEEVVATTTEFARSAPTHISIPALSLEADFVPPLGLNEDKTVEVPDTYTEVGWYKHGATPGEIGPAVVLGHVDSYKGPAVFWPLKDLEAGDEIHIEREDGTTATFVVTRKETYDQDAFPTEAVYGPTEGSELRLVTCTGTYNRGIQRYSHNLVVYAMLKEPA